MFKDKIVIVTGGAQGIGKAITKFFLEKSASVVILDSDEEAGNETEKEFNSLGKIKFKLADVSNEISVQDSIKFTLSQFHKIDFLINNSGIMIRKPLDELSLAEWNKVIGVNLTGIFLFSKYASPYLRQTKGSIVNIASTRAYMSEPNTESYSASKGGIVALTHALAISLGPDVRVNCISPGWIETADWKKKSECHQPNHSAADLKQHPVGRVGKPEDIAALVLYLVSAHAEFITGQNFIVDGGMTRKMIYV